MSGADGGGNRPDGRVARGLDSPCPLGADRRLPGRDWPSAARRLRRAQAIAILQVCGVLGLIERRAIHARALNVGSGEVRTLQAHTAKVRVTEIGAAQICSIETPLYHIRLAEVGAGEIRPGEVCVVRANQSRGPEVGAAQIRSERVGFTESRLPQDRGA